MWLPILGLIAGIILGQLFPFALPTFYVKYMGVGILACLDSVFGGIRSILEERYNSTILTTGFIFNSILAMALTYLGDRIGVELYLAAIFAFGPRLFQNLAIIRRYILDKALTPKSKSPNDGEQSFAEDF
jgi:small basic protein